MADEKAVIAAAAYVRVSSRSQDGATQTEAIERAATTRGDEIRYWCVEKRSAKTLERPGLARLRELVRSGEISRLYLFRLDRLARSGIRDTLQLVEEFRAAGCIIVTIADGFDLSGPAADIVIAVMAWAAQMERLALGERISAARARVEAKGGRWGRPRGLDDAMVKKIRDRANGAGAKSIRAIAMAVKVPRSTVATVLSGKGAYAERAVKPKKKGRERRKPPPSE